MSGLRPWRRFFVFRSDMIHFRDCARTPRNAGAKGANQTKSYTYNYTGGSAHLLDYIWDGNFAVWFG
jgi:hypothetical protein